MIVRWTCFAALGMLGMAALAGHSASAAEPARRARPNILWLTCEDIGPQLGCYGDKYADTPNLDRLASRGMKYLNAWSNAPVCAPARTTIITGVFPPATGSEHMRSKVPLSPLMKMYPTLLREAGYYCTNNSKEDYNLQKPDGVWNESSTKAHWKKRGEGQPFFAIFNVTTTHESQIRTRPHEAVHDPAKVRVPAYHPDTPEVRQDWAQYYDNITKMDGQMAEKLKELADAGLADDTIVFFYGDHGSGMPRSKRWPYNSGLHVPLIVHIPEKFRDLAPKEYRPGGSSDRLVSFVDLAPTLMSLAGVKPPDWMQGYAFLGRYDAGEQPYVYGFRGRMDERFDMVRTVRDKRYVYIRNYMPHLIYGQHVAYMFQTPTTQVWQQLFQAGKLNAAQSRFWKPKPPEELYDLQNDRDEINNLADSPEHQAILARMRQAQHDWAVRIRDVGFLPEPEIHSRSAGSTPYEMGRDAKRCPLERIVATADLASMLKPEAVPALQKAMKDADSAVRYWAALGLLMRGKPAVVASRDLLVDALADESPCVRVVAGEALGQYAERDDANKAVAVLLQIAQQGEGYNLSLMALCAIDRLGDKAGWTHDALERLNAKGYDAQVRKHILGADAR